MTGDKMVTREAFDHFKFYPILFSSNINPSIEVVRFLISVIVLLLGFPPHPIVKKTHRSPSLVWFPKSMLGNLHGTNTNTQIHKCKSLYCAFLTLPRVVSAEQQGENLFLNLFPEWDRVHWSGLPEFILSSAISLAILPNIYQVMKNPFKYISWWKSHLCVGSHRRALLTVHILLQRLLRPSNFLSPIFFCLIPERWWLPPSPCRRPGSHVCSSDGEVCLVWGVIGVIVSEETFLLKKPFSKRQFQGSRQIKRPPTAKTANFKIFLFWRLPNPQNSRTPGLASADYFKFLFFSVFLTHKVFN